MNRAKKEDLDGSSIKYQNIDKSTLIQETRSFNSTPVIPKKCINILKKIIYVLNQGEKFSTQEATDIFFATTKLFQSEDRVLRRLVYLCIKELSPMAQDVIIITSSLTKDMIGKEDLFRAAAIRVLCSISDVTMLQAIERYMKQAIVDKNAAVSSAALVSAFHLLATAPDLVRRLLNEAQEAIMSENAMVSFHAFGLVAEARKNDRLATVKLVTKLSRASLRSPYTLCLLIRHIAKLAEEGPSDATEDYIDFIECCLRNKSEMVIYEAAQALVNLNISNKGLTLAVTVMRLFCGSSKASMRLAGTRTLANLTAKHPDALADCTFDLESLILDQNRSVATLAVTTLLASCAESSIDRLLKQISGFLSEINDEFKIKVVQAIKHLCTKYPRKYPTLITFLAGMLRDEGGVIYKTAIVEAIIALVEENPDAKETGLAHLCEFIEDCEHTSLAVRILNVLGNEGPKARYPSRFIRYIYNRVILESGAVRAAAVSTISRFGAMRPELLPNIRVLLERFHLDNEDEVRDRAILYSAILNSGDMQLVNDYIINVAKPNHVLLEKALSDYINSGYVGVFDIKSVTSIEKSQDIKMNLESEKSKASPISREEQYANEIKVIPDIDKLGPVFKICKPVDLTEPEIEYRVRCVKYILSRHLVLQFECLNTLNEMLLEKVRVRLDCALGYKIVHEIPCEQLPYDKQGNVFYVLEFPQDSIQTLGSIGATLEYVGRFCDPTTGEPEESDGYADTYSLEDVDIECKDQFKTESANDDWEQSWEENANAAEASDTFQLAHSDANDAAIAVCEHLGLSKTAITGDAVKEIRGTGLWRDGTPVYYRVRLVNSQGTVTMQLVARSPREDVASLILVAVG